MSFKIIGIGEVLWDLLPSGAQIGGAPANFAWHAHALGAESAVISRVGNDALGNDIIQRFAELGLGKQTVQVDELAPTGSVTVGLSAKGIPNYVIHENVAWDNLTVSAAGLNAVSAADAVCFGSLAQRNRISRASIQYLLNSSPDRALRVFDINLRQHYYSREIIEKSLELANVLKLNQEELEVIGDLLGLTGPVQARIEALSRRYDLHLVALTRGADGSLLFQAGQWSDCHSIPIDILDTVGAGDSFTAALVMGLLCKMELEEINSIANSVARHVCSCTGAMPALPKEFRERFSARNFHPKIAMNH
jgi:fructokinase